MPFRRAAQAWRQLAGWWWLIGLMALPLAFDPLRIAVFESAKATLATILGVGIGLAGLVIWSSFSRQQRRHYLRQPLILAILAWAVCALVSAILSLSPSRSILGDLYRRMGVLTQFSLLMAFVGGALLTRRQRGLIGPLLAIAGLLVAGYGLLERLGFSPFVAGPILRPSSTLGTLSAASWAIMVVLWLVRILIAEWRHDPSKNNRLLWLYVASLLALLIYLILTQARGAALGLLSGCFALGLTWAWGHQRRRLAMALCGLAALIGIVGAGLYTLDLQHSPVANLPLLGRIGAADDGQTSVFRLLLWHSVGQIITEWPILVTTQGQPDPLAGIRPLVGYGQEMFEIVERQRFDSDLQALLPAQERIDRAHNLWLDTLVMQGGLGLISLLAVYLAAAWMCLRVLRRQGADWGERGWIAATALAILVAHAIDLQFFLPTVASDWLFWASLGLAFGAAQRPVTSRVLPRFALPNSGMWTICLMLGGWLLIWPLAIRDSIANLLPDNAAVMVGLLALSLLIMGLWLRLKWRTVAPILASILVAISLQTALDRSIETALRDSSASTVRGLLLLNHAIYLLVIGIAFGAVAWQLRHLIWWRRSIAVFIAAIIFTVGVWQILDMTADSLLPAAQTQSDVVRRAEFLLAARALRPFDDQLDSTTAGTALAGASRLSADQQHEWLAVATDLLNEASRLNPYDGLLSLQQAQQATYLAAIGDAQQRETYLKQADQFYANAARQLPTNAGLMLEWARFVLTERQQPNRAIQIAEQAQQRTPTHLVESDQIIADASRMLATTPASP